MVKADQIEAIRAAEIAYCGDHPDYYIEHYCHIEDKDADPILQPFALWPAQRRVVGELEAHRLSVILKARQLGVTWLVLALASCWMLARPGYTVIALSRTEDEAKELVRRLGRVILSHMPQLVAASGQEPDGWAGPVVSCTAMGVDITHAGGIVSTFKAFPSASGAGRSFTANLLLLDEWAFQAGAREIWLSTYPTINRPTGGKVIGLSTIDRGTLFEEIYTGDNGFNKIFLPWSADPRRDSEWYARTRRDLGDQIMQEYPATVEEALTIPGGSFFPEFSLSVHGRDPQMETDGYRRYIAIDYGLDMLSAHWLWIDPEGRARVYREYDAPDLPIETAAQRIRERMTEEVDAVLAPPDLWNRSQESGKSRAVLFAEAGLELVKASNDFPAGCAAMKNWLRADGGEPALTFDKDAAPNLCRCLTKIQRDKARPDVYAKEPHELTHDVDSLRYFCVFWTRPAEVKKQKASDPLRQNFTLETMTAAQAAGRGDDYVVI